jgi:hypothetical protein
MIRLTTCFMVSKLLNIYCARLRMKQPAAGFIPAVTLATVEMLVTAGINPAARSMSQS